MFQFTRYRSNVRIQKFPISPPLSSSAFGCVGDDDYGKKMITCCTDEDGVNVQYYIHPTAATGTCAVVITGNNRSLVANLSAFS